jgi:hypothetical protein
MHGRRQFVKAIPSQGGFPDFVRGNAKHIAQMAAVIAGAVGFGVALGALGVRERLKTTETGTKSMAEISEKMTDIKIEKAKTEAMMYTTELVFNIATMPERGVTRKSIKQHSLASPGLQGPNDTQE